MNTRARKKPLGERSEPQHPNAAKLVDHLCAYLAGCMNAEAGEEVLKGLKRARVHGHIALDAALLDIFRSYKPYTPEAR